MNEARFGAAAAACRRRWRRPPRLGRRRGFGGGGSRPETESDAGVRWEHVYFVHVLHISIWIHGILKRKKAYVSMAEFGLTA